MPKTQYVELSRLPTVYTDIVAARNVQVRLTTGSVDFQAAAAARIAEPRLAGKSEYSLKISKAGPPVPSAKVRSSVIGI